MTGCWLGRGRPGRCLPLGTGGSRLFPSRGRLRLPGSGGLGIRLLGGSGIRLLSGSGGWGWFIAVESPSHLENTIICAGKLLE